MRSAIGNRQSAVGDGALRPIVDELPIETTTADCRLPTAVNDCGLPTADV